MAENRKRRVVVATRDFAQAREALVRSYPLSASICKMLERFLELNAEAYPQLRGTPMRVAKTMGIVMEDGQIYPAVRIFYRIRSDDSTVVLLRIGTYQDDNGDTDAETVAWSIVQKA